ncbi:hypothetical protein GCM10028773_02180 [Spirosoma koreense]
MMVSRFGGRAVRSTVGMTAGMQTLRGLTAAEMMNRPDRELIKWIDHPVTMVISGAQTGIQKLPVLAGAVETGRTTALTKSVGRDLIATTDLISNVITAPATINRLASITTGATPVPTIRVPASTGMIAPITQILAGLFPTAGKTALDVGMNRPALTERMTVL